MLTKKIKFKDYNGVEREEVHFFNLSQAEIMEMELGTAGGFAEMIENIIAAKDTPSLVKIFKDLILKAYGIKSPDGRRFEKSENLSTEFSQTEAYSSLFMELIGDADVAADFVNGIVPAELSKKVKEQNLLPKAE